jgi:hypothetical protein
MRAITGWILQMFGRPNSAPITFNNAPFFCDNSGNLNILQPATFSMGGNTIGQLPSFKRVVKPADQTVSGLSLVNDTALLFPIAVSETWHFKVVLYAVHGGGGAAMLTIAFTVPTGATVFYTETGQETIATAGGTAVTGLNTLTGVSIGMVVEGVVVADATHSGSVTMQSIGSTSSAWTIKKNSILLATRMNP